MKNSKHPKQQDKQELERRTPVLLQWEDREMADVLSKLMMADPKNKADPSGGDVTTKGV
jgi:hypothetical protein